MAIVLAVNQWDYWTMAVASIILPVYNADKWLDECLQSIHDQTFQGELELSVYNDSSTDESLKILNGWFEKLIARGIKCILSTNEGNGPSGVGFAKNRAVEKSNGDYLCFMDADDIMLPERINKQYNVAVALPDNTLIGSCFDRIPPGSTERYTKWANNLTSDQLYAQIYLSHGPSVIMPSWFCHRNVFKCVGGFSEQGKGTPEDLIFFYDHLKQGGKIHKVEDTLVIYRHHPDAATASVHKDTIWQLRVKAIQENVLVNWKSFTIWNAGKQGRKFFRSLAPENQKKVKCFCDVDGKKIDKKFYIYEESQELPKPRIPVIHFRDAEPPIIICVKQDLTGGSFEENLSSLGIAEGTDYFHFN